MSNWVLSKINHKWFNSLTLRVGKDESPPFPAGIPVGEGGSERSELGDDFLSLELSHSWF